MNSYMTDMSMSFEDKISCIRSDVSTFWTCRDPDTESLMELFTQLNDKYIADWLDKKIEEHPNMLVSEHIASALRSGWGSVDGMSRYTIFNYFIDAIYKSRRCHIRFFPKGMADMFIDRSLPKVVELDELQRYALRVEQNNILRSLIVHLGYSHVKMLIVTTNSKDRTISTESYMYEHGIHANSTYKEPMHVHTDNWLTVTSRVEAMERGYRWVYDTLNRLNRGELDVIKV